MLGSGKGRAVVVVAALVAGGAAAGPAQAASKRSSAEASLVVKAPFSPTSSIRAFTCEATDAAFDAPTCSTPALSADASTGDVALATPAAPFTVTSPQAGTAPTDGWGAASTGFTLRHVTQSSAASLRTIFTFLVREGTTVSSTSPSAAPAVMVVGHTAATCAGCDADNYVSVVNVFAGETLGADTIYTVTVDMTPTSGIIPKGTVVAVDAYVEGNIAHSRVPTVWNGVARAQASGALESVQYSA